MLETLTLNALDDLIRWGGYALLFFIIFADTGLFFGFLLPGDALILTAGLVAATGKLDIVQVNLIMILAAVLGDSTGYFIGKPLPTMPGEASANYLMGYIRFAHFTAGYILAIGLLGRAYWALVGNHHARELFWVPLFQKAYWGEILTATAKMRGASGAVVNGFHRDTPKVLEQDWPVFSRGRFAQDSSVRTQVVDYRCPIEVGGAWIEPGDLVELAGERWRVIATGDGGVIEAEAVRVVEALGQLASANNSKVVLMPLEASQVIGAVGGIGEIVRATFGADATGGKRG